MAPAVRDLLAELGYPTSVGLDDRLGPWLYVSRSAPA